MSAEVAYLDTSAVVTLLRVELVRVVRRAGFPRLIPEARRLLAGVHLIRLDDDLLDRASDLDPTELRSLDSIHLSAASSLGADLAAVVSYDDRLLAAATSLGLPTATPS